MAAVLTPLVINLERRTDRAADVRQRLEAAGISTWRLWPARDPRVTPAPKDAVPGVWACQESHLTLWRWAAEVGTTITVFEDDAVFGADLKETAEPYLRPGGWDLVKLGDYTVAYVLKPLAARALVAWMQTHRTSEGMDDLLARASEELALNCVRADPWLVTQADPHDSDTMKPTR